MSNCTRTLFCDLLHQRLNDNYMGMDNYLNKKIVSFFENIHAKILSVFWGVKLIDNAKTKLKLKSFFP